MTTPPNGYHFAQVSITPRQARDIIVLLIDVHGVLDHIHRTDTDQTATAEAYLRYAGSDHTLTSILDAIDGLYHTLTMAMHRATIRSNPPTPATPNPTHR
jgi:hypothetical protein